MTEKETETPEQEQDFATFERELTEQKAPPKGEKEEREPESVEEAEEPSGEDGESPADEAEEGASDAEDDADEKPRRKKSAKERIDEVTKARREEERRRIAAEERAADLERRLSALENPKEEGAKEKPETDGPNPEDFEYGEADARYIKELARHEARMEFLAQHQREEAARLERERLAQWNRKTTEAEKKYPDFRETVLETANRGEWKCTQAMAEAIRESESAADIAYHLATNPDEAERISQLAPLAQARAIGRLEAKYAEAPAKKEAKIVTAAPEPPVNRARGSSGKFAIDDDTEDFAAFERKHARS